jgi:hypothetical protein
MPGIRNNKGVIIIHFIFNSLQPLLYFKFLMHNLHHFTALQEKEKKT